jgi:hypothetical protein
MAGRWGGYGYGAAGCSLKNVLKEKAAEATKQKEEKTEKPKPDTADMSISRYIDLMVPIHTSTGSDDLKKKSMKKVPMLQRATVGDIQELPNAV